MICNSVCTHLSKRLTVLWDNVEFFVDKYKSVASVNDDCDKCYDKFIGYQVLFNNEILNTAFGDAKVVGSTKDEEDVFQCRMNILWWHFNNLTMVNSSAKRFKYLRNLVEIF